LDRLVRDTVDNIFSSLATGCPDLAVVAIHVSAALRRDDGIRCFLRSNQIDLLGQTNFVITPVELHMVKHFEPCSDILELERRWDY
jgi:hypothetical protein